MKPIFLFLAILFVFDLLGYAFLKSLNCMIKKERRIRPEISLAVGAAIMVCISQLLCVVFSSKIIAIIWWIGVIAIFLIFRKDYFHIRAKDLLQNKLILAGTLSCVCLFAYPMIVKNEIFSYQYSNNDIIYYLSTIDWFKDHNILEVVKYTDSQPFYLCAKYILSSTRFGFDVLASTLMQMFGIEAHEIFSLLGIVFVSISGMVLYYMSQYILNVPPKYSKLVYILIALSYNWKVLLVLQYVPQIAGICFLMAFIVFMIEYYNAHDKLWGILAALFLAATACTYAEYASYMLIIYVGFFVIQCIFTKQIWTNIKSAIYIGMLGGLWNPLGFAIAVKFNLRILGAVSSSPSNIDAYGGNIKKAPDIIATLFGFVETVRIRNSFLNIGYTVFLVLFASFAVAMFVYVLLKIRTKTLWFISWILIFFFSYECYFRWARLAYGEFKHIVGIGFFLMVIILFCIGKVGFLKKMRLDILMAVFVIAMNLFSFVKTYSFNDAVWYDETLIETREGLKRVPENATLGILGNAHYIQHELIYAAKNRDINLMGSGINSYYTMLGIALNNERPDYILCERDTSELTAEIAKMYAIVWKNDRFMIVLLEE